MDNAREGRKDGDSTIEGEPLSVHFIMQPQNFKSLFIGMF